MDTQVRSGTTRAPRDVALLTHALTSAQGDDVTMVMEVHAGTKEAKTIEKECLNIMQHALIDAEGSAADRLDSALKELNGLLKAFFVSKAMEDIHMIIAVRTPQGALHVSHAGRAEAYLIRRGSASQITEYAKPTPAFVHIASGQLEPRDIVVFSTQRLLRALTPVQLAQQAQHGEEAVESLVRALDAEGEHAAMIVMHADGEPDTATAVAPSAAMRVRSGSPMAVLSSVAPIASAGVASVRRIANQFFSLRKVKTMHGAVTGLLADLTHPQRRRRAHFLLLASSMTALLVVWSVVHLFTSTQRSKTRAELEKLVAQITSQVQAADSRRLIGDISAANEILSQAEEEAKKVMDTENGVFRTQALDLLDTIRAKNEEINNIIRIASPVVVANLASRTQDVAAQGIIGLRDGEFLAYDRQSTYRILQNVVESPAPLSSDELILDGTFFSRFQSLVFLMTGNSVMEVTDGVATAMKTEDPAGWVSGKDIEAYLRYLYVLSPENRQIYKYERLTNGYSAPVEYNVNGDLTDALDMTIDSNVYVLRQGGVVVKLYRGEAQPFVIRRAPENILETATKMYKSPTGNFYFLDPTHRRVIVTSDGGSSGESSYLRQYVLEGEQTGELQDLWVDADDSHLYVLDEKRLYVIDLSLR